MAKGAKKKTKWVSLSLASATTTAAGPTAEHEAESKSSQGTNKPAYGDTNNVNSEKSPYSENGLSSVSSVDRKSSWNTNGYTRRQNAEGSSGQTHSNGYQNYPSRNYSTHFKSHYSRSSYYHNGSRRPHYDSHNDRNRPNHANETKSEQNGAVIINEEEYTKITTPRQDVLFKKGYLSRPKTYTATSTNANENGTGTGSSSVNGTTDGSDVATGSGTVSTTESVTSDSTYLTDGHLLDYPAPLPYFGYIDQSGVLVMNGFAVDNSGFSYMNGGQTYIYPPNYHCQSSPEEDGQMENVDGTELGRVSEGEQIDSVDTVPEAETAVNGLDSDTRLNSITEETVDGLTNEIDSVDLNQQVPQQSMLSPFDNSYDYAQFYNAFYYPGCMVAPFPVMGDEIYGDFYGGASEEEQARQQGFRKRKKRYRNWDEYPPTYYQEAAVDTIYQYPNGLYVPEHEIPNPNEVPIDGIIPEPNLSDRTVPTLPPITENIENNPKINQSINELPSSHRSEQFTPSSTRSPSNSANSQKMDDRSQSSTVPQSTGKPRSHIQKPRKKDLIEMTRAFAEQNIDLTRPVSLYKSPELQKSETSEWRTVRNGKEITIGDDRAQSSANAKGSPKKNNEESEPVISEKLFFDDCKPDETSLAKVANSNRKEPIVKKGKKTSKGKGKKQKKQGLSLQQIGFEVIEPKFSVVAEPIITTKDSPQIVIDNGETPTVGYENADESDTEDQININVEHDEVQNIIADEDESMSSTLITENYIDDDEEGLENDLRDIQLSDLRIEARVQEDNVLQQVEEVVGFDGQPTENVDIPEELIVQNITTHTLENVDTQNSFELHKVPSNSTEEGEMASSETTPEPTCAETMDLIEKNLTVNCNLVMNPAGFTSLGPLGDYDQDIEGEEQKCKHFSNEVYFEDFDSGVQSPAAYTTSSNDSKERKSSSSSFGSQDIHLTDAVTKWLSETLSNKRLEEMFVLPDDPLLLHRIHQFNVLNYDDSLVLTSDTYSSSDEADDSVDSDYMSDVQAKNRELDGGPEGHQKTELKKDQLAKQTANGHCLMNGASGHSNHKQKRCIIM